MYDAFKDQLPDIDPDETEEWIEALDQVIERSPARARFLLSPDPAARPLEADRASVDGLDQLHQHDLSRGGAVLPRRRGDRAADPPDHPVERGGHGVPRANKNYDGIGGHLSTYASAASLYEVGFNHFFRGKDAPGGGDQVFIQGHGAPGIYARAFLEGRLTEEQLENFRREAGGIGLSSYPHPRLMPKFWEFPTVSMGLSPLNAIYQARFNRYLHHRGIKDTSEQRVWAFVGDGEMDEPESMAGLSIAAREGLDNLIFVVNCNLQRLDGPVRGNGKIIQELESIFRGAGWHVIKVVWGREWDDLLARDNDGVLVHKMNTTLDGEFQKYAVESGAYIREHFFGPDPRLQKLVEHLSDDDLRTAAPRRPRLPQAVRGLRTAVELKDAPVVILAKTVKGWGLGETIEGRNVTHQTKKLSEEELKTFRDRLELPIRTRRSPKGVAPYYHPGQDSERGPVPARAPARARRLPPGAARDGRRSSSSRRTTSTRSSRQGLASKPSRRRWRSSVCSGSCCATRRSASASCRSSRTRRARSGWSRCSPSSRSTRRRASCTTRSTPRTCSRTARHKDGQILEEGITEAGSMGSFTAAGTSYATHGEPMIPFFIFYSMFGFQRIGDSIWSLRRPARARVPARRDVRPHDPERRGPAAPGRSLAADGRDEPGVPRRTTRPSLTRSATIVQGRPAPDGARRTRTSSIT